MNSDRLHEMTQVIQLDSEQPAQEAIERAASIIRNGDLVAFPTETVYGLGANAMNDSAVEKIFKAKGRPSDNPLIVHVCNREMPDIISSGVSKTAERLIQKVWPGPLTLVVERKAEVALAVPAGVRT